MTRVDCKTLTGRAIPFCLPSTRRTPSARRPARGSNFRRFKPSVGAERTSQRFQLKPSDVGSAKRSSGSSGPLMSLHFMAIAQSLVVIAAANGAPITCKRLLGARFASAIDGGLILKDGRALLGKSKTWRGVVAAIMFGFCAAVLVGLPGRAGALLGALAMVGDCLSSFAKRRLGLEPSDMSPGLDQVPESLLPALACRLYLPLESVDVVAIVVLFLVGQILLSRWSFVIGLRDRPY